MAIYLDLFTITKNYLTNRLFFTDFYINIDLGFFHFNVGLGSKGLFNVNGNNNKIYLDIFCK